MKKNKKTLVVGVVVVIALIFIIDMSITINKIGNFPVSKPYDEFTLNEKIASKLSGYEFFTKKELEEKGIIYTDDQNEAKKIIEIFNPLIELVSANKDGEDTEEKIKVCESILDELDKENSSGKIKGDNLINFIDDCISMTQNYKFSLEAYNKLEVDKYKMYSEKVVENFNKINNDMSRLGFGKK
ncbi:hypothetical protein [Clostridium ihumii]|uniref:hypothetical protein n=1 Tax=Clostridium ihumii TaxID=1470356 RepID=UPI00058C6BDC|nr:hypothetical protein [Clostridium ihumii]